MIDIWHFTVREWDADRADSYIDELDQAFAFLLQVPGAGAAFRSGKGVYRRWWVGRHRVIYRAMRRQLRIVRVLHEAMDARRHLP